MSNYNKRGSLSFMDCILFISMAIMIVVTIFNANEYVAGLAFVFYPSILLLAAGFVYPSHIYNNRINFLATLLLFSAILSYMSSNLPQKPGTFGNLVFVIISFLIVSSCNIGDYAFRKIFRFYILFSFTVCLILLFNYTFHLGVQVFSEGNERVSIVYSGIAKDVNYLSSFVVPCFVFYLYKGCFGGGIKDFVKAGLVFVAMFVAGSRSCFLAMIASAALIFYRLTTSKELKVNKWIIILSLLLGCGIVYYFVSNSVIFARTTNFENYTENSRLLIWDCALQAFYENKLIGSGIEAGSYYSLLYTPWKTHNCYIDILTGQGIVGAIIIILLFIELARVSKKNRLFMICIMITFLEPLFFVNGYECATMWTPMIICRLLHEKCKKEEDILDIIA